MLTNANTTTHAENALTEVGAAVEHFQEGAQALARSKDEVLKELQALINAAEALLKSSANLSGQALAEARTRIAAKLSEAQTRCTELSKVARVKGRKAAVAADDYVRANPWPVIGTAAGVAFVIGACAARR